MHRRIWFLAAAAVAVFALTGSAAASSHPSSQAKGAMPFAKLWAQNRTPQQRQVNDTVAFGMEQDAGGFNLANQDFTGAWASYFGATPIIRGNYIINQNGAYLLDLASSVKATGTTLTITIKPNADWRWVGHGTTPVTADDYIWTWEQFVKPGNNVASTTGYSLIYKAVKNSPKKVTFYWHKPFADYKDLFGYIYPAYAIKPAIAANNLTWNTMWADCVCGYLANGNEDGAITDGPYYLQSWTQGQGLVLKSNNLWYGANPTINTIIGKIYAAGTPEANALQAQEIDAIFPGLPTGMGPLMNANGIAHVVKPGFTQEHIDVEFGPQKSAQGGTHTDNGAYLLKREWFNQALALSLNRAGVANAIYGPVLGNNVVKPLNNPFYTIGPNATTSKYQYFKKWDYAPAKAIALLKANGCTGGPSAPNNNNTKVWTCGPQTADINFYTTTAGARCGISRPVWEQNAMAVGINLHSHCYNAQPDFFTNLLPTGAFDLAEYAFTGGPDPSGWDAIYQCKTNTTGGQNYKNYCNPKVDAFIKKGDSELNASARLADYQNAANLVSQNVAIIPLYARPALLFYNNKINGMENSDNPTSTGPLWNAEKWNWGP